MQRTFYYKANTPQHALLKLENNKSIVEQGGVDDTWTWTIVSVEEVVSNE